MNWPPDIKISDGYAHCGLSRYRPIEDVQQIMKRFGVRRSVLVQHLREYDNSYIERIVAANPETFAGVMHLDVETPNVLQQLDELGQRGHFRGIRLLAPTLETHLEIWQRAAQLNLHIVIYDEPTLAHRAQQLAQFANEHPHTQLILSHLGMLDLAETPGYSNHKEICDLGNLSNVLVQLSGFHMFAKPPYEQLVPVVKSLVEAFGPQRLYYGSNYPVMKDEVVYGQEIALLQTGRLGVPIDDIEWVMAKTADQLWFDRTPTS